jgi:hypothetical protein
MTGLLTENPIAADKASRPGGSPEAWFTLEFTSLLEETEIPSIGVVSGLQLILTAVEEPGPTRLGLNLCIWSKYEYDCCGRYVQGERHMTE